MILPVLEREKVNLDLPIFTLDVNLVALREPSEWPSEMRGLAPLEWNYFEAGAIELCVTPVTAFEITKGQSLQALPYTAYQRLKKTEFLKARPPGTTLALSEHQSNILWGGIRDILWPGIAEDQLTVTQRADVTQLYFHSISSGSTCSNSAYLTRDQNYFKKRRDIATELGVTILNTNEAWEEYSHRYSLYQPTVQEIAYVHHQQQYYLQQLSTRSSAGL